MEGVRTEFRPTRRWRLWEPDPGLLRALVDLCERTWPNLSSFRFQVSSSDRTDEAENPEEARQLINAEVLVVGATGIDVSAHAEHASVMALRFHWYGRAAELSITGTDQTAAEALTNMAAAVLDNGAIDSSSVPATHERRAVEQQTKLPLDRIRFAGTYVDLGRLVVDLAEQVRQVRGNLDYVYLALTEHGHTLTVYDLDQLNRISERDIRKLRHLTVALGSHSEGPSLSLYVTHKRMMGDAMGPDEAPVRTLRAAANDLLRDRGRSPHWLTYWHLWATGVVLYVAGLALSFFSELDAVAVALYGAAVVLYGNHLYVPEVELLSPGQRTRWSRFSRYVVGLIIAWLIGSLAVPFFSR